MPSFPLGLNLVSFSSNSHTKRANKYTTKVKDELFSAAQLHVLPSAGDRIKADLL